jgi:hypothetical protein
MALSLLNQFLDNDGDASGSWTLKNLMLNEGRRVIFINHSYNSATGKLKYAASVFRRDPVLIFEDGEYYLPEGWEEGDLDAAIQHGAVVEIGALLIPYYQITEDDVENHIHTTAQRYEIRPVRMEIEPGMSYEEVIHTIRWEMCHGYGCKGTRKGKNKNSNFSDTDSENSFLSTDSLPEMSDALARTKTVHHARYMTGDRDIFISFKGRSQSGEIAYGAAIHRRADPDDRMSEEMVAAHWDTSDTRLERSPVVYQLSDENKEFSHQLKRSAVHREDITILLVDNIFKRRGGRIQVKNFE